MFAEDPKRAGFSETTALADRIVQESNEREAVSA